MISQPSSGSPVVSVIIPARNCAEYLETCLESLKATRYAAYEVIVVDDASTDRTPEVATARGFRCLRLQDHGGPARARNEGARAAAGEYLLFLDADVCVYPETVGRVVEAFAQDPALDALFGSYDTQPRALNLLSLYKNLFHHFVHQVGQERATTFWTGCGAIRRAVFHAVGGFDESYARPCIEDIELGIRLTKSGHPIALRKEIQVTHLKRWTLWDIIKTDVRDRAIPWTRLLLRERTLPNDLNLTVAQRISAILSCLLLGTFLVGAWFYPGILLLPLAAFLAIHLLDVWSATRRVPTLWRVGAVLGVLGTGIALSVYYRLGIVFALVLLLGIVLINYRFYVFFGHSRPWLFAALVVPLHILYYLYSVVGFVLGVCSYLWHDKAAALSKPRPAQTNAEVLGQEQK